MISKKNEKGFTLVELAIVLVIIGLILGAVMKGQDIIAQARAKRLSTALNSWSALAFTYMDRMGYMPGDKGNRNGIIGDNANEQATTNNAIAMMVSTTVSPVAFANAPVNPMQIGNATFWVYFGNAAGSAGPNRNIIVICASSACNTAFSPEQLGIIMTVDTSIDQVADAGLGVFRGATAATVTGYAAGSATVNNYRDTGTVNNAITAVTSTPGTATDWGATHVAAVWTFDTPF